MSPHDYDAIARAAKSFLDAHGLARDAETVAVSSNPPPYAAEALRRDHAARDAALAILKKSVGADVLRRLEWGDDPDVFPLCPLCFCEPHEGHAEGCQLRAAIAGTAEDPSVGRLGPGCATGDDPHVDAVMADAVRVAVDASVKRLPIYADGPPAYPGDVAWSSSYRGVEQVKVESVGVGTLTWIDADGDVLSGPVDRGYGKLYSARSAAMAAWPADFAAYKAQPGNETIVDPYANGAREPRDATPASDSETPIARVPDSAKAARPAADVELRDQRRRGVVALIESIFGEQRPAAAREGGQQ